MDPVQVETSTRKRLAMKRQAKLRQGYERNVPRCGTCTFLLQRCQGNENAPKHEPMCNRGGFVVALVDVCDQWEGRRGELLAL